LNAKHLNGKSAELRIYPHPGGRAAAQCFLLGPKMSVSIEELKRRLKIASKEIEDFFYKTPRRMANIKKQQAKAKGKERPPEVRKAISDTLTGRSDSEATRAKKRESQKKRRERERAKKAPD
jgi:lipoate-protein ligase A